LQQTGRLGTGEFLLVSRHEDAHHFVEGSNDQPGYQALVVELWWKMAQLGLFD
jgi:hypothetical protein